MASETGDTASLSRRPAEIVSLVVAAGATSLESGAAAFVVVGGRGSGRSTVLAEVVDAFASRWGDRRVLSAGALSWETDTPGAVLHQLLQDAPDGTALADAVAADGPHLIAVDDLELADPTSRRALLSLLAHHRRLPLTMVWTDRRSPDPAPGIVAAAVLPLAGLTAEQVMRIADDRGVTMHPHAATRLTAHAAGNPRYLNALIDQAASDHWSSPDAALFAPTEVVDEVRTTLKACTPDVRRLVEALAILAGNGLEHDSNLSVAATLAGLDDPLRALDGAVASGLLTVPPGVAPAQAVPRFTDGVHRTAIIAAMGLRAASETHRRAAELVADPIRELAHLVAAATVADPLLADLLDRHAHGLGAGGEWARAAELYRHAARLSADGPVRDERLTRAADALLADGDCLAASALMPAVESLRETPLRDATLAYLAILRGRRTEADMRLDRAWAIRNTERDPDTAGVISQRRVLHSLVQCQGDDLVMWADTAIELAGPASSASIEASVIKGLGLGFSGHIDQARSLYAGRSEEIRHGAQAQRVAMGRGWLELACDDVDAARSSLETAVSMAHLRGSSRIAQWAVAWLARVHFVTGEWDLALDSVERGRHLARTSGIALVMPLMEWTAAQVHALRGDFDASRTSISASLVAEGSYEMMQVPTMLAQAAVAEAAADYAAVRDALGRLPAMAQHAPGLAEPGFWPWVDQLANALVQEGSLAEADRLLSQHEGVARQRGHRSAQARLGYARGRFLGASGDLPAARRAFEESLAMLDGLPLRYDRARINFAYGQTLRRAGKRRAADAVLTRARDLYESLGAVTYVQRCERELRAGGLNAPRGTSAGVELTPQEQAVVALVVQGATNREVAAELYISQKTVQYHLTRVFGKVGVRSRAELTAKLQ